MRARGARRGPASGSRSPPDPRPASHGRAPDPRRRSRSAPPAARRTRPRRHRHAARGRRRAPPRRSRRRPANAGWRARWQSSRAGRSPSGGSRCSGRCVTVSGAALMSMPTSSASTKAWIQMGSSTREAAGVYRAGARFQEPRDAARLLRPLPPGYWRLARSSSASPPRVSSPPRMSLRNSVSPSSAQPNTAARGGASNCSAEAVEVGTRFSMTK